MGRETTMSKYLISLTPTGKFFFGNDTTFPIGQEKDEKFKKHNEQFSSYIVHSNYFPQQTSLLGMLRFLLLSNSNAFDKSKQSIISGQDIFVTKLIGKQSFVVNDKECLNDFGNITSISPCFLQMRQRDEWTNLFPAPMDYKYVVNFEKTHDGIINGQKKNIPTIEGYNPKEMREPIFLNEKMELTLSDVFSEDIRVGINKDYSGVTKDTAFYKQINLRFGRAQKKVTENAREFRFAFVAEVEQDMTIYNGHIVSLGADGSTFVIEAIDGDVTQYTPSHHDNNRVVLLSDAFIEDVAAEKAKYAITQTQPFRFLRTTINTTNYNVLSQAVTRSGRFSLYKRGSTFYFNDLTEVENFKEALDSKKEFVQIGYNIYNK